MFDVARVKNKLLRLCTEEISAAEEKEVFGIACSELLKNPDISGNFTREEIQKMLRKILFKSHKIPLENREKMIDEEVVKLKELFSNQIKEWIVIVPIENLELHQRFLKIGNVKFYTFDNHRKAKIVKLLRSVLRPNPHYSAEEKREMIRSIISSNVDPVLGKVCGETKMSGRLDRIYPLAIQHVIDAMRVMKLYRNIQDDIFGRYLDIMGETVKGKRITFRYPNDKKSFYLMMEFVGTRHPYKIDPKKRSFMRQWKLEEIGKILAKSNPTPLERRLLSSIFWYSRACEVYLTKEKEREAIYDQLKSRKRSYVSSEHFNLCDRLIKLTIALESLLIRDENEPIQSNVAERCALFLGENYTQRKRIKKFIKNMYGLRSKVVHHGWADISNKDLDKLTVLTQSLILNFVKRRKKLTIYTEADLFGWFEKKKLGG